MLSNFQRHLFEMVRLLCFVQNKSTNPHIHTQLISVVVHMYMIYKISGNKLNLQTNRNKMSLSPDRSFFILSLPSHEP